MRAPPPLSTSFLYSLRQGTSSSFFSISAMPFCIWIAAGLSRGGYLTAKLSRQKYRTGCWAVLSNGRALQRSWFSTPLSVVLRHTGAAAVHTCHLLPSARPDPAAMKTPHHPGGNAASEARWESCLCSLHPPHPLRTVQHQRILPAFWGGWHNPAAPEKAQLQWKTSSQFLLVF